MAEYSKSLNPEDLELVAGGDYGDTEKEKGENNVVNFMYNVGDEVEVYTGGLHVFTYHAVIVSRQAAPGHEFHENIAYYSVRDDKGVIHENVTADWIQS